MTLATSMIPTVLDALNTQWRAALPSTVDIHDGPPTVEVPASGLYIGAAVDGTPIRFDQSIPVMGARRRDETFDVPNLLYLRTGDTADADMSATRTALFTTWGLIESSLRADSSLGIAGNTVRASILSGEFSPAQTPDGIVCRIAFTVRVETRI